MFKMSKIKEILILCVIVLTIIMVILPYFFPNIKNEYYTLASDCNECGDQQLDSEESICDCQNRLKCSPKDPNCNSLTNPCSIYEQNGECTKDGINLYINNKVYCPNSINPVQDCIKNCEQQGNCKSCCDLSCTQKCSSGGNGGNGECYTDPCFSFIIKQDNQGYCNCIKNTNCQPTLTC